LRAQALRDNAALLDELSNKLQQKEKYFVSLYNNIRAKAYQDLGFRPLTVGRISTLYLDIAYRQYMQAYYYSKTQGEERQILANQIVNKYDDDAKILIEQAEQATQEARWYLIGLGGLGRHK
jgi:hypothetical protein